tara:strand:- start:101 stop:487 length:387 start_codon:yes stop_codon:yes gene_type:complete
MFGKLIKKLVPIAIAGASIYTGAKMWPSMSTKMSNMWASSSLTDKYKEKLGKEAIKRGFKNMFATSSSPNESPEYNVNFDKYLMEIVASQSRQSGVSEFGQLQSANPEAIAYAWQRRLNSYMKSGDIV